MGIRPQLWAGLLLLAAAAGCTKTITLQRVPACCGPTIRTVAVAPFNNRSSVPQAADWVAERLAAALVYSRTYDKVIGPRELMARLKAVDITMPTDDPAAAAHAIGQLVPGVDALVVGTVEAYDYDRPVYKHLEEPRDRMIYPEGGLSTPPAGGGEAKDFFIPVADRCGLVRLAVTAKMVSVPDGDVLAKTSARLGGEELRQSDRERKVEKKLIESCDAAGRELSKAFIKVPVEVKIEPEHVLRTACLKQETRELVFTRQFKPADNEVLVIIALPPEAARNDFCVMISARGEGRVRMEREFVWGPRDVERRIVFPRVELTENCPTTHYAVSLYTQGKSRLLVTQEFEISQ